jgi:pimeloyl-ACP methyl ester carboxylesterase
MTKHRTAGGIAYETGGDGPDLLLLVHGLAANAAVWRPLLALLDGGAWPGRWAVPDLRGHGRSTCDGPFGYGTHAADLASVVDAVGASEVTVVGHSFGGVLGALLGSDLFATPVRSVLAAGVKLDWSADDVDAARRIASRGRRVFDSSGDAAEYALRLAGLTGLAGVSDPCADVVAVGGGFAAAVDPRVFSVVGPDVRGLLRSCRAPVRLVAGDADPMVSLSALRSVDPDASLVASAGHCVHWEQPSALLALLV